MAAECCHPKEKEISYRGIMSFTIYITNNKTGEECDITELDAYESDYIADESMELHDIIDRKVKELLSNFGGYSGSYQVEPYTRNGGPLIDYSITLTNQKKRFYESPLEDLDFEISIDQGNGWTATATTRLGTSFKIEESDSD